MVSNRIYIAYSVSNNDLRLNRSVKTPIKGDAKKPASTFTVNKRPTNWAESVLSIRTQFAPPVPYQSQSNTKSLKGKNKRKFFSFNNFVTIYASSAYNTDLSFSFNQAACDKALLSFSISSG